MATALDIIRLALRITGVSGQGQTPSAEDSNDAFTMLNMMLAQWQRKRWLVYHLRDLAWASTGAVSYTIGPGGDVDVVRPDQIESAFARLPTSGTPNAVDFPLHLLESKEDYNLITLKGLISFPSYVYYDPAWPLGVLYVWPTPPSTYQIHVSCKEVLTSFADLADEVNLPDEYQEALLYNLAMRLRPAYQLPADASIAGLARASLATIRATNAQIPIAVMPPDLVRRAGYAWSLFGASGGGPPPPTPPSGDGYLLRDGSSLLLRDGSALSPR